jgi:GTP-binding protein
LLDISDPERDPVHDYEVINHELACFGNELGARQQILVITKMDLPITRERLSEVQHAFTQRGIPSLVISAVTREGLKPLLDRIMQELEAQRTRMALQPTQSFNERQWEDL